MASYLPKPELTQEQHARELVVPWPAYQARIESARIARDTARGRMSAAQAGAVTTFDFEAKEGWKQWVLLQSDNHHDSILCNRELEDEHLETARQRGAMVMMFGDILDAMQGRFDPRRSMSELRPEYRRDDYYDVIVEDAAHWYGRYAEVISLMCDGNHELSVLKNANTNILANLIKAINQKHQVQIRRGGYGGWVRLVMHMGGEKTVVKRIKYFHGSGGEAPVTRGVIQTNRQAVYLPDADIVVNGHSHNMYYVPISRERLSYEGVQSFDVQHHVRIPGYKQAYGDGMGGWEVTRGGVPKPIGAVWLLLAREGDEIKLQVVADIRGADVVTVDPEELYSGRVYAQDGEGA